MAKAYEKGPRSTANRGPSRIASKNSFLFLFWSCCFFFFFIFFFFCFFFFRFAPPLFPPTSLRLAKDHHIQSRGECNRKSKMKTSMDNIEKYDLKRAKAFPKIQRHHNTYAEYQPRSHAIASDLTTTENKRPITMSIQQTTPLIKLVIQQPVKGPPGDAAHHFRIILD